MNQILFVRVIVVSSNNVLSIAQSKVHKLLNPVIIINLREQILIKLLVTDPNNVPKFSLEQIALLIRKQLNNHLNNQADRALINRHGFLQNR